MKTLEQHLNENLLNEATTTKIPSYVFTGNKNAYIKSVEKEIKDFQKELLNSDDDNEMDEIQEDIDACKIYIKLFKSAKFDIGDVITGPGDDKKSSALKEIRGEVIGFHEYTYAIEYDNPKDGKTVGFIHATKAKK